MRLLRGLIVAACIHVFPAAAFSEEPAAADDQPVQLRLLDTSVFGKRTTDAIVLLATTAGAILLLGRVRSRSKLLSVGVMAAGVAALPHALLQSSAARKRQESGPDVRCSLSWFEEYPPGCTTAGSRIERRAG